MKLFDVEFIHPERLWMLLIVPVIGGLFFLLNYRKGIRKSRERSRINLVLPKDPVWKRYAALGLTLLSLITLIVAYAMPKGYTLKPRDRATIIVTIDTSFSMAAEDIEPSRIEAAKLAARSFVQSLPPRFNVALVSFAATAQVVVPPSIDRIAVIRGIDSLGLAPSTAIGEGIYTSLNALDLVVPDPQNPKNPVPSAMVLLSDGSTNTGRSSVSAANAAKKINCPIYTIAYGTSHGYLYSGGYAQRVDVDRAELKRIAQRSGGKSFTASSTAELKSVYSEISKSVGYEHVYVEVTDKYVGYALLLAVLAALGAISLAARWP